MMRPGIDNFKISIVSNENVNKYLQSKNLTEAIYFSDWSNASPEAKKLMLMFMVRTQKPFQLTGNGYIVMNMNSYSSVSY